MINDSEKERGRKEKENERQTVERLNGGRGAKVTLFLDHIMKRVIFRRK